MLLHDFADNPERGAGGQERQPPLLVCMAAKVGAGCSYKSVRQEDVERAIIDELPMTPKFRADAQSAIDDLATRLSEVESTIANLVKQAGMAPSKALSDQLYAEEEEKSRRAEEQKSSLESALDAVITQASPLVQTVKRMGELVEVTSQEPMDVPRANALMRQLFKCVVIDPTRRHISLWWQSVPDFELVSF